MVLLSINHHNLIMYHYYIIMSYLLLQGNVWIASSWQLLSIIRSFHILNTLQLYWPPQTHWSCLYRVVAAETLISIPHLMLLDEPIMLQTYAKCDIIVYYCTCTYLELGTFNSIRTLFYALKMFHLWTAMTALKLLCLQCIAVVYHCTDCFLHVGLMNDYRTAMNLYM